MTTAQLRGTGFFRLWVGESVSVFGSQVGTFAIPLIAVITLSATPWEMGLLSACGSAAPLLLGLSAGVIADRYERIAVMHVANLSRMVAMVVLVLVYVAGALHMWLLCLTVFLVGALTQLFDSARAGLVPRLVPRSALPAANSWMQGSVGVGDVTGPGVAGALVQILSAPLTVLIDAASYLVSSIAIRDLPKARPENDTETDGQKGHIHAIRVGLRVVWRDNVQRPLALAAAHFNVFHSMFFAVFMLYAIRELEFTPAQLGLLVTATGVAGLVAVSVSGALARRFGYGAALIVAYGLPGAACLLVPAANGTATWLAMTLVAVSLFVWSCSVIVNIVLSESVKQAFVPDRYLGRVTSTIRFLSWGVEPIGALLGGVVASTALGFHGTFYLCAAGLLTSMWWPLRPAVRRLRVLEQPEPSQEPATETGAPR